jgi:hypothetical protein
VPGNFAPTHNDAVKNQRLPRRSNRLGLVEELDVDPGDEFESFPNWSKLADDEIWCYPGGGGVAFWATVRNPPIVTRPTRIAATADRRTANRRMVNPLHSSQLLQQLTDPVTSSSQ